MITHWVRFGWIPKYDIVSTLPPDEETLGEWIPVEDCKTMNEAKQKAWEYCDCMDKLQDGSVGILNSAWGELVEKSK